MTVVRPPRLPPAVLPGGGIVRPPRRPEGWFPPGPRPRTPEDRPEIWPREGEDLCYLAGDWRILQRVDGHRWSLDDLVTAWWAWRNLAASPSQGPGPIRVVDLGCGIGTVLLLTAWRLPEARLVGVEAQTLSVELARRSILFNGIGDRCSVRHGDFREPAATEGLGPADLVTGTPPYFARGSGTESVRPQVGPCHFEHRGGLEEYVRAAARLLDEGGLLVFCLTAGQWDRVEAAADGWTLESRLDLVPRDGKPPLLGVAALRRGPAVRPPAGAERLVVRDRTGLWTPQFNGLRREMGLPPGDGEPGAEALCSDPVPRPTDGPGP